MSRAPWQPREKSLDPGEWREPRDSTAQLINCKTVDPPSRTQSRRILLLYRPVRQVLAIAPRRRCSPCSSLRKRRGRHQENCKAGMRLTMEWIATELRTAMIKHRTGAGWHGPSKPLPSRLNRVSYSSDCSETNTRRRNVEQKKQRIEHRPARAHDQRMATLSQVVHPISTPCRDKQNPLRSDHRLLILELSVSC